MESYSQVKEAVFGASRPTAWWWYVYYLNSLCLVLYWTIEYYCINMVVYKSINIYISSCYINYNIMKTTLVRMRLCGDIWNKRGGRDGKEGRCQESVRKRKNRTTQFVVGRMCMETFVRVGRCPGKQNKRHEGEWRHVRETTLKDKWGTTSRSQPHHWYAWTAEKDMVMYYHGIIHRLR